MWKENFSNYVTGIAFNLQLSKPMCDTLVRIAEYRKEIIKSGEINWVVFENWPGRYLISLERRGLIEHANNTYKVTEAGRLVYCLIKMAFDKTEERAKTELGSAVTSDNK